MNETKILHVFKRPLACWRWLVTFLILTGAPATTAWTEVTQTQQQTQTEDCAPFSGLDVNFTEAQCHALKHFFSALVGYSVTRAERCDQPSLMNITPLVMLTVNGGKAWCWIYAKNDTICHFFRSRSADDESGIENSTLGQAISREKAFASALPVLTYCKGPTEIADYRCEFIGGWKKPTDSLKGCVWTFTHSYAYKGTSCLGPILSVDISAYSGRLESMEYWPPTIPKFEPTTAISKDAALKAAAKWQKDSQTFGKLSALFAPDAIQNTKRVIAWPNGGNNRDKEPAKVPSDEARYYWQVPFSWTEDAYGNTSNTFNATILVDMETSEVIGVF